MKRLHLISGALAALLLAACGGSNSPPPADSVSVTSMSAKELTGQLAVAGGAGQASIDSRLARARGSVDVWVTLSDPSLAEYKSAQLTALGLDMQPRALAAATPSTVAAQSATSPSIPADLSAQRDIIRSKQSDLMSQLGALGAQEIARVHVAHNALAITVDASALTAIAALPGVTKVRPVLNYSFALSETVPYVGAAAAQAAGKNGTGVRVAVLDTGVDYTHYNLGGPGSVAAYAAAYGASPSDPKNTTRDGLFPTAKVVDGYDFVGETWPNGPLAPDDDPIDFNGHGTHVADIIAGRSNDGK